MGAGGTGVRHFLQCRPVLILKNFCGVCESLRMIFAIFDDVPYNMDPVTLTTDCRRYMSIINFTPVPQDNCKAKFAEASHHHSSCNHDAQWDDDGIHDLSVSDIPILIVKMHSALETFPYHAVTDYMATDNRLSIENPDTFKKLVSKNAMNAISVITGRLVEGKTVPLEFWLDETWLQADIAFTLPIHCRIRRYSGEEPKVILEYIPSHFSSTRCERR